MSALGGITCYLFPIPGCCHLNLRWWCHHFQKMSHRGQTLAFLASAEYFKRTRIYNQDILLFVLIPSRSTVTPSWIVSASATTLCTFHSYPPLRNLCPEIIWSKVKRFLLLIRLKAVRAEEGVGEAKGPCCCDYGLKDGPGILWLSLWAHRAAGALPALSQGPQMLD